MKKFVLLAGVAALVLAGCSEEKKAVNDGVVDSTSSSSTAPTSPAPTTTTTSASATTTTLAPATTTRPAPSAAGKIAVPHVVGKDLQLAQDTMQAAGLYMLTSHDSTGQNRSQILDRNWVVTDQTPAAGTMVDESQLIDLGAQKFTD